MLQKHTKQSNIIFSSALSGSEIDEVYLAIENALIRNGQHLFDKNILPIFALYDNRKKFNNIRAQIKRLRVRIESGKETPLMKRILIKTVNSKEKILEQAQELNTTTPASSSTESESEEEIEITTMTPLSSSTENESEADMQGRSTCT